MPDVRSIPLPKAIDDFYKKLESWRATAAAYILNVRPDRRYVLLNAEPGWFGGAEGVRARAGIRS